MSSGTQESVKTAPFDMFMPYRVVGDSFEAVPGAEPRVNNMLYLARESTMIAATSVGVVVGRGAQERAEDWAMQASLKHDLFEPLWDKAPHPIEGDGALQTIPRKVGEARGMYFARVIAAVIEDGDKDKGSGLTHMLAAQLLFEQDQIEAEGKKVVVTNVNDNKAIQDEIASLERILASGKYTDLSPIELKALELLVSSAKEAHEDLQKLAVDANVEAVQKALETRRVTRRTRRMVIRAGALACAGVTAVSAWAFTLVSAPEPSAATERSALEEVHELQSVVELSDLMPNRQTFNQDAKQVVEGIQRQIDERLADDDLNEPDRKLINQVSEVAALTSEYLDGDGVNGKPLDLNIDLDSLERQLELPEGSTFFEYAIIGGVLIGGYGLMGGGLLLSASKDGGRRDNLRTKVLPRVQAGQIPNKFEAMPVSSAIYSYNEANWRR